MLENQRVKLIVTKHDFCHILNVWLYVRLSSLSQNNNNNTMKNQITFVVIQGTTTLSKTIETNKDFKLSKSAASFAGMLHNAHLTISKLSEQGIKVLKPFSYHKPFNLTIEVNGVKVVDSIEANEASFLTIVLKAKQSIDSPAPLAAAIIALSEIVTLEY